MCRRRLFCAASDRCAKPAPTGANPVGPVRLSWTSKRPDPPERVTTVRSPVAKGRLRCYSVGTALGVAEGAALRVGEGAGEGVEVGVGMPVGQLAGTVMLGENAPSGAFTSSTC